MKGTRVKYVRCEICENEAEDHSQFRAPHQHPMIVVSAPDDKSRYGRRYYDVCSLSCLEKLTQQMMNKIKEARRDPRT